MESSRIFVKGLPPNLSADDFKRHFSKQSAITDAKFIPHRRIGYVGYKTPEDAAKAVKYHNKSFIRMSKIGVELARSVEDQYALGLRINNTKREHTDTQAQGRLHTNSDGEKKRKRKNSVEDGVKNKLQEFLEVMQPPSKSKVWENQDAVISQASAHHISKADNTVARESQSDEIYEHVPKRMKKERKNEEENVVLVEPPVPVHMPSVDEEPVSSNRDVSPEATQEPVTKSSIASDADWLRSRTSRLLGLVDDDDVQLTARIEEAPTENMSQSEVPELVKEGGVSDASVQADENLDVEGAVHEHEAIGNGRLFVRNLTYTATEEDLRRHFEDGRHGTIEEVSPMLYRYHLCMTRFS